MEIPHPPGDEELIRQYLYWVNGAVLAGSAVFYFPGRDYVLIGLMLCLPLLDRRWQIPSLRHSRPHFHISAGLVIFSIVLLAWKPSQVAFAVTTLVFAAIPEEWFFRAYFMTRTGHGFRANATASVLFSLMHGLTQGWVTAMLVFLPSLFYGWLYQRTRDLPLLVLLHALSNLVYVLFLSDMMATWTPDLR